jgi:hypothetical protein
MKWKYPPGAQVKSHDVVVDCWCNLIRVLEIGNPIPNNLMHQYVGLLPKRIVFECLNAVQTLHESIEAMQSSPRSPKKVLCLTSKFTDNGRTHVTKERSPLLRPYPL